MAAKRRKRGIGGPRGLAWMGEELVERGVEAEALGAEDAAGGGEELRLFLPTPAFMASAGEE